jgi:mRNA interferase RelE/StbE
MIKQVILSKGAVKYLARIPRNSARKITQAIRHVAEGTGRQTNTRKLSGRDLWRLRVGRLRVIYESNEESGVMLVLKIGPRGDVYK